MTRKFCTRWEFLPPPIAEKQGFARAAGESNTRQKFCSILVSPQFPATPLIALLWEGKLHLDLERVMSPSMSSDCRPGTPKCQSRFGSTSNPSNSSELPNPVLGLLLLALEHMSMHVARVGVDKSRYVFVCMLKVYGSRD